MQSGTTLDSGVLGGPRRKASDAQLASAYASGESVQQVAAHFGMCGQSVHERLQKLGLTRSIRVLTVEEEARLRETYSSGMRRGDGKLDKLARDLGRTKYYLCRQARRLGLTSARRSLSPAARGAASLRWIEHWATHDHPKGMLGKRHTQAVRDKISKSSVGREMPNAAVLRSLKTKVLKYGKATSGVRHRCSWKSGWRTIGASRIYARSRWEANYARYLEHLASSGTILRWEHEPKVFLFEQSTSGCRSFLPDFRVTEASGEVTYHEVKGWLDDRSREALARMAEFYPEASVRVFGAEWYRSNARRLSKIVPGWELGLKKGRLVAP